MSCLYIGGITLKSLQDYLIQNDLQIQCIFIKIPKIAFIEIKDDSKIHIEQKTWVDKAILNPKQQS